MSTQQESWAFQSDINQLLSLIINTFYQNKEVCFRELISNASDANDKYKYASLKQGNSVDASQLYINIIPDKSNNTLTIADNGIGMTKDDLIQCLGTIAKSGTKEFIQKMMQDNDGNKGNQIGQFGVGFYSAYLIADKVSVVTKSFDHPQYVWESNATGTFTIAQIETPTMDHGTSVILHLKENHDDFFSTDFLKELVKKHSEFVVFPIMLQVEKEKEKEIDADNKTDETVLEFEHINQQKPVWTLSPSEVTHKQYASFYKSLTNDSNDHLAVKHFSVEGGVEMKSVLYIPRQAPLEMNDVYNKPNNIKLYVKKVFITDDSKELIPPYLCFVRGMVDSDDLPLNISREFLQNNRIVRGVQKNIVKKSIEMMKEMADDKPDDYKVFYKQFSKYVKLGIYEDSTNRSKLQPLLRFRTTKTNEEDEMKSVQDYVTSMQPDQKGIYYIIGESQQVLKTSPLVEFLVAKGYEVILMTEPLDEYIMQRIQEYEGKQFICISKNTDLFDESEDQKKEKEEEFKKYEEFCTFVKNTVMQNKQDTISKVSMGDRIGKGTPCIVTTDVYGITANMERIMKAQSEHYTSMPVSRKVLLLNPNHKLIQSLFTQHSESAEKVNTDLVTLMYDAALLTSGYALKNPAEFTQIIYKILQAGMNMDDDDDEDVDDEDANQNQNIGSGVNELD